VADRGEASIGRQRRGKHCQTDARPALADRCEAAISRQRTGRLEATQAVKNKKAMHERWQTKRRCKKWKTEARQAAVDGGG
jgi:hypothetical protein